MWLFLLAMLDPGSALLVLDHGKVVRTEATGTADLRTGERITAKTNFRLASVSKQFTATAILLLRKDGKISLDDAVARHLAPLPAWAAGITVRHLLTHTSGVPDYDADVPDGTPQLSDADVLAFVRRQSAPLFAPGARYRYSNTGYALLALIVERASGQPFPDFLRHRIFRPLGMKKTVAHVEGRDRVPHRAYGHARTRAGWKGSDQSPTSAVLGDGGIYSNLQDLARWVRALDRCQLLDCATLAESWSPTKLNDGSLVPYGYGWRLEERDGEPVIGHTGETRGFRNALLRYPRRGLVVILLTNRNEGTPANEAARVAREYQPRR